MDEQEKAKLFSCEDGDTEAIVEYKGERLTFKVSSHALRHASPMLKNLLDKTPKTPPENAPKKLIVIIVKKEHQEKQNAAKRSRRSEDGGISTIDFSKDDGHASWFF
jgi:predicted nucleic acid binding AN1-type Zn finger protein